MRTGDDLDKRPAWVVSLAVIVPAPAGDRPVGTDRTCCLTGNRDIDESARWGFAGAGI
jgi:hypothetical protein